VFLTRRDASSHAGRAGIRRSLVGALLFCCVLSGYLLLFNVDQPYHNGDWSTRYEVTCAIVEHNSFAVRPRLSDARVGPGVGGHSYAQYTLGQTTAMIPLYLLGRRLAGVTQTRCGQTVVNPIVYLTAKALDFILAALLCVLFFATARLLRYAPRPALALTFVLAFGTSLWPDALSSEEHTLESLFLLAAVYAALRYTLQRRRAGLWVFVMGLAAGLVFVTRIAGVIALPIFALYLVILHRRRTGSGGPGSGGSTGSAGRVGWRPVWRDLLLFALGAFPSLLVNAVYDALRFGSPLRTAPYHTPTFGYPPLVGLANLLVSPGKGLLWYTPAVFALALALRPFWRRFPLPSLLFGLICAVYLAFYANVVYWHGDPAWGPRYLYPLLPYLVLPLGEVFRRWREYRLRVRGAVVGVLAASFLVQLAGVTVSYWRYWHVMFGYHFDQIRGYVWGYDFNSWWRPAQSPIFLALSGVADIAHKAATHTPLLQHTALLHLSEPNETPVYRVVGHASLYLTDADEFRYGANWNTFTPWWLHQYPWWDARTVALLALALVAVCLVSGGALLALLATPSAPPRSAVSLARRPAREAAPGVAARVPPSAEGVGGRVLEVGATGGTDTGARRIARRPASGYAPVGGAALLAAAAYAGLMVVAVVSGPRSAPPLIATVSMGTLVRDGTWTYRVLRVVAAPAPSQLGPLVPARMRRRPAPAALPRTPYRELRGVGPWDAFQQARRAVLRASSRNHDRGAERYIVVLLALHNRAGRPVHRVLTYRGPARAHHLALLGPGLARVRLNV